MANNTDTSELGQAIQDVTERASLLVREEIELAKTEMSEKASKLGKGAGIGGAAGIFAVFGLIYLLHSAAWGISSALGQDNPWLGYLIVAVVLFIVGGDRGARRRSATSSAARRRRRRWPSRRAS